MDEILLVVCSRDFRNELVVVECETLTGKKPVDGIAEGGVIDFVPHAAYLRAGIQVIAKGRTLEEILDKVKVLDLDVEEFRVELLNISDMEIQNLDTIIAVADAIQYYRPNLNNPKHRLLLLIQETGYTFGEIVAEPDHSYRQHDDKPYRTSSSLPAQLSRALVNLVLPSTKTILDPCCGTGSILLEAQAMGLEAYGGDWNPKMVGMSQKNVAHFEYSADIALLDAREWSGRFDAIVTDLPYGINLEVSEEVVRGILTHCVNLAPVAVFVAGQDMTDWFREAGYHKIEVFRVPKYNGFVRYVHRAFVE